MLKEGRPWRHHIRLSEHNIRVMVERYGPQEVSPKLYEVFSRVRRELLYESPRIQREHLEED